MGGNPGGSLTKRMSTHDKRQTAVRNGKPSPPALRRTDPARAAHDLRLAPNTVSTLVGRLAEQDLLRRERSLPDSRSVRLPVTETGRRRLAEGRDLRAELASEVLATLSEADRRALAGAIPALVRLAGRMEPERTEHR